MRGEIQRGREVDVDKKSGRATSGDRGGEPTVQVARPLLGDRRCLSRGRRLSAQEKQKQALCLEKTATILGVVLKIFSLSATRHIVKSRIRPNSLENRMFCNL